MFKKYFWYFLDFFFSFIPFFFLAFFLDLFLQCLLSKRFINKYLPLFCQAISPPILYFLSASSSPARPPCLSLPHFSAVPCFAFGIETMNQNVSLSIPPLQLCSHLHRNRLQLAYF